MTSHASSQGVRYLHHRRFPHGRLKSRNCVVDSRFVLKITDHGYEEFLEFHCSPRPQPDPEGWLGGRGPPAGCAVLAFVKQGEGEVPTVFVLGPGIGGFSMLEEPKVLDLGMQENRVGSRRPFLTIAELLWTAPELLRGSGGPGKASFKGDIFSLGIILQEVLTQGPPYCSWGLPAEGTCPP